MALSETQFQALLEFRTALRRFNNWSEEQARSAGLTPAKHQLLLAVKGHPGNEGPTVGEIANHLVLRHHSAVGLIDRAVADGLVQRTSDAGNRSIVRVTLTPAGIAKLDALSEAHLEELDHLAPVMRSLWRALARTDGEIPHPAARSRP